MNQSEHAAVSKAREALLAARNDVTSSRYERYEQAIAALDALLAQTVEPLTCKYAEDIGLPPHACTDCSFDLMELQARFQKPQAASPQPPKQGDAA